MKNVNAGARNDTRPRRWFGVAACVLVVLFTLAVVEVWMCRTALVAARKLPYWGDPRGNHLGFRLYFGRDWNGNKISFPTYDRYEFEFGRRAGQMLDKDGNEIFDDIPRIPMRAYVEDTPDRIGQRSRSVVTLVGWPVRCFATTRAVPLINGAWSRDKATWEMRSRPIAWACASYVVVACAAGYGVAKIGVLGSALAWRLRARHRKSRCLCLHCGYPQRGLLVESPCPECGFVPRRDL